MHNKAWAETVSVYPNLKATTMKLQNKKARKFIHISYKGKGIGQAATSL